MGAQQGAKPISRTAAALMPKFIGHREDDVAKIRTCIARGDFETIARLGHNLCGNGPSYGFPELAELGERLEEAAEMKNADLVQEQLDALMAWLQSVGELARRTESGTHPKGTPPGERSGVR